MNKSILSTLILTALFTSLYAIKSDAFTPAEIRHFYANCVAYMKLPAVKRRATASKIRADYAQLNNACASYLHLGVKRIIELENEYQNPRSSGGFLGSLGCLSNEHYIHGGCSPKSLDRCTSGAECAFGESCSAGVCH